MFRKWRAALLAAILFALAVLSGCAGANAAPILKLGVIAPFEGAGRPLGYAILPAIKQAVADANARSNFGPYRVLVVAFNDDLDAATAARQAQALAMDPAVLAVVGPCTPATVAAAQPYLAEAELVALPLLSDNPASEDQRVATAQAQTAASALLQALAADIARNGAPTRAGLAAELVRP